MSQGVTDYVVDSSSIEVNRRSRRAKTDRLDLVGLPSLLARYVGDHRTWRVVGVPTMSEEGARHCPRTLEALTQDRTRLVNRLKSLLLTQGLSISFDSEFANQLDTVRLWDGTALPPGLRERLLCRWTQLQSVHRQMRDLKAQRVTRPVTLPAATADALSKLWPSA